MAISKIDSDGITAGGITADSLDIGQIGGRKNIAYNGAMTVWQRGTSADTATSSASRPCIVQLVKEKQGDKLCRSVN